MNTLKNRQEVFFFDTITKQKLEPPFITLVENSLGTSDLVNVRLPYIGQPCSCHSLTCGCCAGMKIESLNFNQKVCLNFTYDPMEFEILMEMNMNGNSLYENSISGKNPPALCLPIPTGPLPLGLDMCVKVFNIYTPGYNLHMCMDMLARFQSAPIVVLHFDCMRFGLDEFVILKPDDNGGNFTGAGENNSQEEDVLIPVIYDHVDSKNYSKF